MNKTKKRKLSIINKNLKEKLSNVKCDSIESMLSVSQTESFLRELGGGQFGLAFKGCFDAPTCENAISIKYINIATKYSDDYNDENNPSNIEVIVGKALRKLVYNHMTPHINFTIFSLICNHSDISKNATFRQHKAHEWLINSRNKLNNNEIFSHLNITFNELASMDLKQFISNKKSKLKDKDHLIILFQFCYTLSCIQYYFKNFKHNDIKPNNLLVKLIDNPDTNNYLEYKILGETFYIPQTKYIIKLHDFDYVYSDTFQNKKITHSVNLYKKGYNSETNSLFDLHSYINFYYHTLYNHLSENFKKMLEDLVPTDGVDNIKYSNSNIEIDNPLKHTLLGKKTSYTNNYKLTSYNLNSKSNYIPKKMHSCADLLCSHDIFKNFKNLPSGGKIIHTYDSKIPYMDSREQKLRPDMFNINLHS